MPDRASPLAHGIIVFGRGHAPGRIDRLSDASLARVGRLGEYLAEHAEQFAARRAKVVLSGGFAGAAGAVAERPSDERCEGTLMAAAARELRVQDAPLARYADLVAEIESSSTLENAIQVRAGGYFDGMRFDARHPLGLIAHAGHVERAAYYCGKIFGLHRAALLPIVAVGGDQLSAGLPEPLMNAVTRAACLGAHRPEALLRRERMLVRVARALRHG
jgi:hypothetical protein